MTNLDRLITYFESFPGIGARQARRFAFHVLTMQQSDTNELADLIRNLQGTVTECARCHRFFAQNQNSAKQEMCTLCLDPNRDRTKLMVVERDTDVQSIERSRVYDGLYFVLGGTLPLLSESNNKLRSSSLKATIDTQLTEDLSEVILAFSVNPDGENTARYIQSLLQEKSADHNIKITQLGRGLSTGSELEYADPETIKNALTNRV